MSLLIHPGDLIIWQMLYTQDDPPPSSLSVSAVLRDATDSEAAYVESEVAWGQMGTAPFVWVLADISEPLTQLTFSDTGGQAGVITPVSVARIVAVIRGEAANERTIASYLLPLPTE